MERRRHGSRRRPNEAARPRRRVCRPRRDRGSDICEPDQVAALRDRLSGRVFDMLFVNAGVTNNPEETIAT
jgi:hypothetical protein